MKTKLKLAAILTIASIAIGHVTLAQADSNYPDSAPVAASASPAAQARAQARAQRKAARKVTRTADRKLATAVRKALAKSGDVSLSHVAVLARSGAVTLAGTVPDTAQIDLATRQAQGVAGVTSVKNNLTLQAEGH